MHRLAVMKPCRCILSAFVLLSLAACGQQSAAPATVTSAALSPQPEGRAHALVLDAASCWLSGLWSDAAGDPRRARDAAIADRCKLVLGGAGAPSDRTYYALRAVEPNVVDELAARIDRIARADGSDRSHAAALVAFFRKVAGASREEVDARRAADRVKEGYSSTSSADARRAEKDAAAPELTKSEAVVALLEDASSYKDEARVVGVLFAVDRMEIARGLPKHLKIACVSGVGLALFGVTAPRLSGEAAAPIPTGTWLGYLSSMASAAGHPVPSEAHDPQDREPLAWNGVLEGLADQLRHLRTGTVLDPISENVVARLDRQAASARAFFDAHPAGAR